MASKISSAAISFLLLSLLLTSFAEGAIDSSWTCPNNILKSLGTVTGLLGIPNILGGSCCSLLGDLTDDEATVCLCVCLKSLNLLGLNLVDSLLTGCGRKTDYVSTLCVGIL